mmetsp:Transcript_14509/g.24038  ORF Transcript_14509/g.24038 Transcript_14509/m.24038 type:complete len:89 (-) Transcript_14509:310-576(-)
MKQLVRRGDDTELLLAVHAHVKSGSCSPLLTDGLRATRKVSAILVQFASSNEGFFSFLRCSSSHHSQRVLRLHRQRTNHHLRLEARLL